MVASLLERRDDALRAHLPIRRHSDMHPLCSLCGGCLWNHCCAVERRPDGTPTCELRSPYVYCDQKRYAEIPLTVENFARYEAELGETRIEITREGHEALVEALGGECPHCNRAMPEGEPHV